MSLKNPVPAEPDQLNQLAGLTGLGWTVTLIVYVGVMLGFGAGIFNRFLVTPHALLILGLTLFLATLGLERLRDAALNDEN